MANRRIFGIGIFLAGLSGCIFQNEDGNAGNRPGPDGNTDHKGYPQDSVTARKLDSLARANDSLRAAIARDTAGTVPADPYQKDLAELASKLKSLPIPMGTRYFAARKAAPKSSAAMACKGDADVMGLGDTLGLLMGMDTISCIDSAGARFCTPQPHTAREQHRRYLFAPDAGESRESILVEITEDDMLPRYLSRGTGALKIFSGLEFIIQHSDVEMVLDNSKAEFIFKNALLELTWRDGYVLRLELAKSFPIRGADLFPAWVAKPEHVLSMSGTITKAGVPAGFIDLFADRTVAIRDRAGKPVQ